MPLTFVETVRTLAVARSASIRREAWALLCLGGPVVGTQLAQISMHTVDAIMAGRLGPRDLAAVSLGGSLWMPIFVFGMGILMSISPNVAHSFGAGESTAIGRQVRQGLWLSQVVALGAFLVIRGSTPVLEWFGVDPQIIPTATGFLRAISWGLPALCAFVVLRGFSEAVSMTRPLLFISLLALAANIAGNSLLMYGRWGLPRLGAVGTGISSAIVMWLMFGCLLGWIAWHPYYRRFEVFGRLDRPDFAALWKLLKLGVPIGVCLFMEGSLFAAVALLLGRMGEAVVAGHQIAINVASITFMVPLGISIAVTVRVGQALGRQDVAGARRSGTVGALLAMSFMALAGLTLALIPRAIAAVYTPDPGVQVLAVRLLYMAAIFQVFDGLQVAGSGALRGLKDTSSAMLITVVAYWGVGLPLGYFLGIVRDGGPQAMWTGLIVGLVVSSILLNLRFQRVMGRRLRTEVVAGTVGGG
ncbi:MAG: MATE family efflux transporter [Planctomycetales bacterium]